MMARAKRSAALILSSLVFVLCGADARQNANNSQVANQSQIPLKATSNLVLVRVVVRDAQGKPVEGLKKQDFKLFDQGKQQTIDEFESKAPAGFEANSAMAPTVASGALPVPIAPALPENFLVLYFDDLNTAENDMVYAREAAAQYLASNLDSQERVAIFTPEKMLVDFTSDQRQIDEALANLHASSQRPINCPNLSDYQALEITRNQFDQEADAWQTALNEALKCGVASSPVTPANSSLPAPHGGQVSSLQVLQVAQHIVNRMQVQERENLQQISEAVKYISKMPGQRAVVLVSPGFLSQDDRVLLDNVIDRALHSRVVISSLDPNVLGKSNGSWRRGAESSSAQRLVAGREAFATAVLEEVAQGTGGEYVHDSNDLKDGFSKTAGSPAYYILGFAPSNMKPDGKFHALKVTLAEGRKSVTLQARRGYFAPANEAEAETEITENEAANAEAQRQEQLREALFSKSEIAQFPLDLHVSVSRGRTETHDLSLYSHIDGEKLHFARDGEHNRDTVRFFFAVFDQQGNVIASQLHDAKMDVVDSQMEELRKTGLNVGVTFHLKRGNYRVREVAMELEGPEMATVTRDVKISGDEEVASESVVPWDPPDVDAPASHLSSSNTCSLSNVLALAAGPAKSLVDNLQNFDAHEQIRYEQTDISGEQSLFTANFDYLVDFTRKNNHLGVREIRTPLRGTDPSLKDSISDSGLPVLALIFDPSLRSDYEMRCEGTGLWANRPAWVIYFRQIQGKRSRTAAIATATEVYPVSLKGRAWVATDSGEVIHLETNLLKGVVILSTPQPLFIRVDSVSVDYAPVRFASKEVVMWLPRSEITFTDYADRHLIIQHTFSDFRLFSVQTNQTIQTPNPHQQ